VAQGLRVLGTGNMPAGSDLLLTQANARRLADRLSELRGAAMKVGQLLSMEGGDLLPREFTDVLARLRDNAHSMPMLQLAAELESAWGGDWLEHFERFFFQPVAAASIGQVHRATAADGRLLAIKVQYPGVRDSIDSDVDNVAGLLSFFRLIPNPGDLDSLLREAKRQLHEEADYLAEASYLEAYRARTAGLQGICVPRVDSALTRHNVLVMEFVDGEPIEALAGRDASERNAVAARLLELFLKEVFDWGLVQTDANFSNYFYLPDSRGLGLLDFGATRRYSQGSIRLYRRLLAAAIRGDRKALTETAEAVGYLGAGDPDVYRSAVCALLKAAAEPARALGSYDFARSDLARRMTEQVLRLRVESRVWRMPPPELLFLHRKLGGLYMLCTRLAASVNVGRLVEPYLAECAA
jgi:predicted unusual protein kinase regulating ubiquinone biosynthesis (AarF/ABC1/UbiB family)